MNITALSSASVRSLVGTSTSTTASAVSSTESSQSGVGASRSSATRSGASAPPGIAELSNAVGKLQDLAESDPEAFTVAATEIANALREAAGEAGGTGPLADLADRFEAAAKSGDASQLAPPRPPEGGKGPHGPPPGGAPPGGGHGGPPPGGTSEAQRAADAYKSNSSDGPPDFSALAQMINSAIGNVSG
ncbi:MAG: hypothetical protein IV100_19070 [Myxococcales bacterium]|nr:hypothetical protein [Myxococcales bacterium]